MLHRDSNQRIEVDELLEKLEKLSTSTEETPSYIGMILNNRYKIFNKLDNNDGHCQIYQVNHQNEKTT
jgi:hypothetical protein